MCRINQFCWCQTIFKVNVQDFLGTNGIKGVSWGYHGWYPKGIHEDVIGIDEFLNWIDMFISFHLVLCIFSASHENFAENVAETVPYKITPFPYKMPNSSQDLPFFTCQIFIDFLYLPNKISRNLMKSPQVQPTSASCPFPCCIPVSAISGVVIWTKAVWFLLRKMEPDTGGF